MQHTTLKFSLAMLLGVGLLATPSHAQLPTATGPKPAPAPTVNPNVTKPAPKVPLNPNVSKPAPSVPLNPNATKPAAKPPVPVNLYESPLFKTKLNNGRQGLRGFVDMHAHPMSHLAFGGHLMHGAPGVDVLMPIGSIYRNNDCNRTMERAKSQAEALGSCYSTHAGHDLFKNKCGNHVRRLVLNGMEDGNNTNKPHGIDHPKGHPTYDRWPKNNDILHQQMWVDWIERSYKGGMRVMVALAVNNYTLATGLETSAGNPRNDKASGDLQIKELERFVNKYPWMKIARSAADLRRIVGEEDKLAIIIGAELDDIGDFVLNKSQPSAETVRKEIRRLHSMGVRYIFPVHLIDNHFGGTAAYESEVNRTNCFHFGQWWKLKCTDGSGRDEAGITARVESGNDVFKLMKLGACGAHAPVPSCKSGEGHMNTRDLKPLGREAVSEMMRLGMIIDIDHTSVATLHQILEHTKTPGGDYPLVSGHNGMRKAQNGTENERTRAQYNELVRRTSIAGVGWGALRSDEWLTKLKDVRSTGIPIAIGSDINGMVVQPRPRAGCTANNPCVTYNASFPKPQSGSKTWDYNRDGVAHVGLFPDVLKDIETQHGGQAIVNALFDGAEGMAKTWERAESIGKKLPKANVSNGIVITSAMYGRNCGIDTTKANIKSWVSEQCEGNTSCNYRFTWAPWGGRDPNPSMCKKEIDIQYRCGSQTKREKVLHNTTPQTVNLRCP